MPEITGTVATAAYRITQEALTNVARHAGAGRVRVRLWVDGDRLSLNVTDDGRGFDVSGLADGEGLGLAGMRERAALTGGRLDITSDRSGTRVTLQVQLDNLHPATKRAVL
jgi:signal transduction histidine kinase